MGRWSAGLPPPTFTWAPELGRPSPSGPHGFQSVPLRQHQRQQGQEPIAGDGSRGGATECWPDRVLSYLSVLFGSPTG